MAQLSQRPPDLDDDHLPIPIRSSVAKSPKPPDIEPDEPSADELVADAKLSLDPSPVVSGSSSTAPNTPPQSRGFYESFSEQFEPWTEPLTDYFSRSAKKSADIIDSPRLNRSPFEAQVSGFTAGATEGLGKVLDSMTSPVNLAMELATLGKGAATKAGLKTVARALNYGVKGLGAATATEGVKHTIEGEGIAQKGMGIAEIAGGLAATLPGGRPKAKAKVSEVLPVKPPYESPIVNRPYEPANYAMDNAYTKARGGEVTPQMAELAIEPILDESGRNIAPAQSTIQERPAGNWDTNVTPESLQPKAFNPATLQGMEPAAVVPEGVDPATGEILEPVRRTTKRMGAPDLGPVPETRPPNSPDLFTPEQRQAAPYGPEVVPETPVAAEPAPTFESWLDRLKSDRGILNVTEIADALAGREPSPTKVEPTASPDAEAPARNEPIFPNRAGGEFLESMSDESITDFISRQSGNPGYQFETGQRILRHAQDILDSRAAGEVSRIETQPHLQPSRYQLPAQQYSWRQHEARLRSEMTFGDTPERGDSSVRRFETGQPYPTTQDAIHNLNTPELREFVRAYDVDRKLTSYATGVLQERNQSFDEHGNYRDNAEPTTSHTGSDPFDPETPTTDTWYADYQKRLNEKAGKSLDDIESTRKTPALERLGKLIGEDRAKQLTSGDKSIEFDKPARRDKGKKLHPSTARSWAEWGDVQLREHDTDPTKPGLDIHNGSSVSNMFPDSLEMVYRDASGKPIGVLKTDLQGKGISTLAVDSNLGLRRGKVAFEMLKQAFDRGITEPSGATSDFTNNLIERVKRLARSEKGELNLDEIYSAINDLIGKVSDSKFGQAFGRMIKDETGSANINDPINALKELFEKSKKGALTPEELTQAKKLAKEQGTQPEAPKAQEAVRLPQELQGARPRFNVGADSYIPKFADDLDKALYITAQRVKSPSDAKYLKFAMEQTGLNEQQVRNAGAQVRSVIKRAVAGHEPGSIDIPSVYKSSMAAAPAKASVPPQTGTATPREYLEGKSQVDTGPIVPENAGVSSTADVVTDSLSKRLKKAVDEAGQSNAVAPEEISSLVDEATQTLNQLPNGPEKQGIIRQVLGANKALLTSWDVSAPGRQGKAFMLNKAWWTSLDDMVKAWGSAEAAKTINDSITEHPSGYFTKSVSETGKVGKSFADKAGLELASTEEMFNTALGQTFEKYSGIGKSSRAHTAFLNKLRSDQFVSMMEGDKRAGLDPEKNLNIASKYATFINDATGRGSVNIGKWKLERNLNVLNDVFFAPKNMAGQIRTWNNVLNPMKYANADPVLRKQALKSLFAIAGLGLGVGEMSRLAGAQVSNDPTNPDFRKIRIGDSHIDMFGGYQQFPVAMMKLLSGQSTSSISGKTTDLTAGRYGQQTRASIAQRFFTNRLSPVGSMIWAWMDGREFDGKSFEAKRALYERIFPIAAKDIWELAQEDPWLAAILTPSTMMGLTGTQHYSGRN